MKNLLILFFALLIVQGFAQNTVGLTRYNPSESFEGYNLHFPHNQGNVYLLNNCGEIVHVWADSIYKPGNGVWLHSNGNLYVAKGRGGLSNPFMHAAGGGEKIEIRDWDNSLLWTFTMNDSTERLHHDIAVMPNGNVLAIAWEYKSDADAIAAGRDPAKLPENALWPEKIVEIQPNLSNGSATIVWEWRTWDHLIQDFDSTKANYGNVGANPHRVDINYTPYNNLADWQHANAIDYNPNLDQIVISIPTFNEIWIIDHSTTTAQAASNSGGLGGRGGDLLYRFGNPAAYRQSGPQLLHYQHDIHWAEKGLSNTHPEFGKLVVFNNQVGADYSTAHTFSPVFDSYDWEYTMTGNEWGPTTFDWTYQANPPQDMHSTGLSSVQILPNSNRLICEGRWGRSFEINDSNEIVWEYVNPLKSGNPVAQGDTTLSLNSNLQFRMTRYAPDFSGFAGKTFEPMGYLELNPDTSFCSTVLNVETFTGTDLKVNVFPNPASENISVSFIDAADVNSVLELYDLYGRQLLYKEVRNRNNLIDVSDFGTGIYILRIDAKVHSKIVISR